MTKTVSVRMEEEVKQEFEAWCKSVGMNVSTAVNMFAKEVLRSGKLPFTVKSVEDKFYSEANMKHLEKSIQEYKNGKIVTKSIDELEKFANG